MTSTGNSSNRPDLKIAGTLVPGWPKLAWAAELADGSDTLRMLHGPRVEVTDRWAAEAVWCGDFQAGDFDLTDQFFGSGVRLRGREVIFCCSGTTMDRLWLHQARGRLLVSNSLAALCAVANISLLEDRDFRADTMTAWGSPDHTRTFPVSSGEVTVAWYCNLVYSAGQISPQEKPDSAPRFRRYEDYVGYLVASARRLGENLRSPGRTVPVSPVAAISSGYDSPAVAWVARHAGCIEAVTIGPSNSLWRGSDSGAAIARRLGLNCRIYPRTAREYPNELAVWAACGRPSLLNMSLFEYPGPVNALFMGNFGDSVWSLTRRPSPYHFLDLGFSELRLWAGAFQCVIPFWGMRHQAELDVITFSRDLVPWRVGGDYDRPIARRILEEAGVPRGTFAVRKKNVSHEQPFRWPYAPNLRQSLREYLQSRGRHVPPDWLIGLYRPAAQAEKLLHGNLLSRLGLKFRFRPWLPLVTISQLAYWSNQQLRRVYRDALPGQEQ